ncbi:hypothetical protein R3X27_14110 [Tropicimonas sp. TH_r6]|uniref:hypothetical protein n=1 Tax=Tropicimonas sp. TH_r6 TaxID=3082085 RepID=UPI0029547A5C|nr:hypothetical protein [Tropicimonas sp. TH_r6]MDV7143817.1 hypothetical protein [Tropicimonas sp. TH_r6]
MPLPSSITATLLLSHPAQIDSEALCTALAARIGPELGTLECRTWRGAPLLSAPKAHVLVQPRDLPLTGHRFDTALDSQLLDVLHEDPDSVIGQHRAAVTLSVGTGAEPSPSDTPPSPTQDVFDQLLILGHGAASQLAQQNATLAVHWQQSGQFLSAERFAAMSRMLFPLPLFLHPRPEIRQDGRKAWLSLELFGATELIGRSLRSAPAPVAFDWLAPRLFALVSHLRADPGAADGGLTFATAPGERFRLREDADGGLTVHVEMKDGKLLPVAP